MAISEKYKGRYIFHFTDMENLDSIIKNGLLCTNVKNERGIVHKNIANMTIQERRANMDVPVGPGGKVHDYVPFYFSSINPMLLKKLNEKNVDQPLIIYLCVKIERLDKEDAVFTDASANTNIPPTFYDDPANLDKLNWDLIDSRKWGVATTEDKHMKMAEAMIHKHLGMDVVDAIVVYNDYARKEVERVFKENEIPTPTILYDNDAQIKRYSFYYTKLFFEDRKTETLVFGPLALFNKYCSLINEIKSERHNKRETYSFHSIAELVNALDEDITVLPELKNIVRLLQDYEPHNNTVDDHTKRVVEEMKKQDYYINTTDEKKYILLLAAYLHDIGKGPMCKWTTGKMNSKYPDHTLDAIPMLARILTEEIETLSEEEIRLVCMLVVYHDIVGDCMVKERDKTQIVRVIESEDDLEMLFAISCADTQAIQPVWSMNILGRKESFCSEIMKMKQE